MQERKNGQTASDNEPIQSLSVAKQTSMVRAAKCIYEGWPICSS